MAGSDESILRRPRMHQHDIDVTVLTQLQGLAGTDRDDVHLTRALLLEFRQQKIQQAGIGRAGRGRQAYDILVGGEGRHGQ